MAVPARTAIDDRNPIRYLNDGVSQDCTSTARTPPAAGVPDPVAARGVLTPARTWTPRELPDDDFPLVLNTGRLQHQWHTMTKTGKVDKLNKLDSGPFVEIHPRDAPRWTSSTASPSS